jgi:hypothetical protein
MVEPTDASPVRVSGALRAAILVCLVAVAALGLWPRPLYQASGEAGAALMQAHDR